jgi:hypothetical protein
LARTFRLTKFSFILRPRLGEFLRLVELAAVAEPVVGRLGPAVPEELRDAAQLGAHARHHHRRRVDLDDERNARASPSAATTVTE